jgi:hypothetical protein
MADETLDKAPDDSVASALASAIAQHEGKGAAGDTGTADAGDKPRVSAAQGGETVAPKADKETTPPAAAEQTEATKSESEDASDKPASETETAEKPVASGTEPPANWAAKDKETFKGLPAEAQKFLLDRHKSMEAAFTKKTQEIAEFRREFDPVNKIFEPYRDRMKAAGYTPIKLIQNWFNVEKRLMEGEGVDVVAGLVRGYQVNLGDVARALGLTPRQTNGNGAAQPGQPDHQPVHISPEHPIMRELSAIQARLAADDNMRVNEARRLQTTAETRVMSEIDQFKSALDDKGSPLHPHFDELEEAMTHLAQSAVMARKPVPQLKELYETAVWANPSTREATLAARERAQQAKAADEARAKAAQARKAGSSVTGAPGSGQAPTGRSRTDLSLREQLEANFADTVGGRI